MISTRGSAVLIGLSAIALGAGIFGFARFRHAKETRTTLAGQYTRQTALEAEITATSRQLEEKQTRAAAIQRDNGLLSASLEKAIAAQPAKILTELPQEAEQRIARLRQTPLFPNTEASLKEILWCWDKGVPALRGSAILGQRSFVIGQLIKLAEKHEPARQELRVRFEAMRARMLAGTDDEKDFTVFGRMGKALGQPQATLELHDALPAGAPLRTTAAIYAFRDLVEAQRYGDAVTARTAGSMASMAERIAEAGSDPDYSLRATATHIEVLAGVGRLGEARTLAERALKLAPTTEARALIEQHLKRAGQPDLLQTRRAK